MSETRLNRPAEHTDDLLAAVALGTASPEEQALVDEHVVLCDACRAELDAYRHVAARLPSESRLPEPSSATWHGIASRVSVSHNESQPFTQRRSWPGWRAAAALLIIASVAGLVGGIIGNRVGGEEDSLAALENIATDDLVFTLAPNDPASPAVGRIFMSTDRTRGVVAVTGLGPLPDDESYAVWLVKDDETRENLGTFTVDSDGTSIAPLSLPYIGGNWDDAGSYVALSISRVSRADPSVPVGGPIMVGPIY